MEPTIHYQERLLDPQWDALERHFGVPMPKSLKDFYADLTRIQQSNFRLQTKEKVEGNYFIAVLSFTPMDKGAIREFDNESNLLCVATDGMEGEYLIDPTECDPEIVLMVDYSDYHEMGLKLSEFLTAPHLPQNGDNSSGAKLN